MKNVLVLEFITSLGGVQSVYKNILPELAKEHKIFFLNPYSEKDDLEIGKVKNIEIIKMPIKTAKALGWKKSVIQRVAVCVKYGAKYMHYIFQLAKLIRRNSIELLYVSGKKEFFYALLMKFICKTPYIYHAHGFGKVEDINWLTKLAIKKAKYVICVSSDVEKKIRKSGADGNNIVVVSNALNLEEARKKTAIAGQKATDQKIFTVVFGGTIQEQKGVLTLVKAIMLLSEKGYNLKLDLIGNCNSMSYLNEIKSIADDEIVSICGFAENIYDYFLNADLVVLPSKEESFGMVLLEAMYAKKPVIGSNIGGIPDIIIDGETGYLFECGDHIDLAEKIMRLYSDKTLCHTLGMNGFSRVCSVFGTEKQARLINALIHDEESK